MKRIFCSTSILLAVSLIAGVSLQVVAQQPAQPIRTPRQTPLPVNPDFSKLEVQTLKVQGNIYLLAGAGGNIAVQAADEGVLIVDSGFEKMSDKVLAAIRKVSNKPIRMLINTTLADDHTGGNAPIVKAGLINQAGPGIGGRLNEAVLIGHANLLRLMTEIGADKIPTDRWPPNTYPGKQKDLYSNDEPVVIMHVASANTSGDSMVWFRKSDVVVTGEVFNETSFPYIDLAHGGSINGLIECLNTVLDITV